MNFIDSSSVNSWNVPVLHDAIRATIFSSRWQTNWALPGTEPRWEVFNTMEDFRAPFDLLDRLLALGADVDVLDSAGNPALMRACLDAAQVMRVPTQPDQIEDLEKVFRLLRHHGADPAWQDMRFQGRTVLDAFADKPFAAFLR